MSVNDIKTYPRMDEIVKEMLADDPGPFHSYIAKRIEELEAKVLEQDQELYKLRGEYSTCTVDKNRAVFALRMIAGIASDLPEGQNGPEYAWAWLKKHDLIADQEQFNFNKEKKE